MTELRKKTCCFTGHRTIPADELLAVVRRTEQTIRLLVEKQGVRYFGVGGAIGYDTEAAELLFRLKREYPQIRVVLVYPFDGFTDRWSEAQKERYARLLPCFDKVVRASVYAGRDAYLIRNRHLVDGSAHCIAYFTKTAGGTAYTVRYAQQCGLQVHNVALKG